MQPVEADCPFWRIRQVALWFFRQEFGTAKIKTFWHKDGFMSQAISKQGNTVTVYQENRGPWKMIKRPVLPLVPFVP